MTSACCRASLVSVLLLGGCASWVPVAYTTRPSTAADPAAEVKNLLNGRKYPAVQVEVTDGYTKEIWIGNGGVMTMMLQFSRIDSLRIITKEGIYQISAYDAKGQEFWAWRPAGEDLKSCKQMIDALYALMKRPAEKTGEATAAESP